MDDMEYIDTVRGFDKADMEYNDAVSGREESFR